MFSGFAAPPKPLSNTEMLDLVREQILREAGVDFESRPVLAVYACYLPNPAAANYDTLLNFFFQRLNDFVENDYVVVLFAAGIQHQPGWSWLYKAYSHMGRKYRKNLKSLYVVHPSLWPRLIIQGMGAVVSPKFARKVHWVYNLDQLGASVPLNQLFIPDVIREVDAGTSKAKPSTLIDTPKEDNPDQLSKVFGAPLHDIMGANGEKGIPRVIADCIHYIRTDGLETEGIFRRSPSSKQLQHAKRAYNRDDEHFELQKSGDVHLACVLLKSFFRDLPEPVFSGAMYDVIRGIHACENENEQVKFIGNAVVPLLPVPTFQLVAAIFSLLHQVHLNSDKNLMTANNLTIVWSPNLVRSDNPVVDFSMGALGAQGGGAGTMIKLCIERYPDIFVQIEP
ncbi:hypothetical protein PhCBS80983_g01671 [Powellomyces hirtus]|uniref:Rho-GAP domain-containing protein n=1 Tax=Powellomyces hirtus TaxID=109895 RepID=A0A507E9U9_9FUNG|nr:hypothetical protein PhCBS80983_g01671 [Powellomyces hirtus]